VGTITIHGDRAWQRSKTEPKIRSMIAVSDDGFERAAERFRDGRHAFIKQNGHLTSKAYEYGITFVPTQHLHARWSKWFDIREVRQGAIHDWQNIVALSPKKL
jgi:hypothetical protein